MTAYRNKIPVTLVPVMVVLIGIASVFAFNISERLLTVTMNVSSICAQLIENEQIPISTECDTALNRIVSAKKVAMEVYLFLALLSLVGMLAILFCGRYPIYLRAIIVLATIVLLATPFLHVV